MSDEINNEQYQVGYRRPPKHSQFKKGQSGNPKGRKKKEAFTELRFRDLLLEAQIVEINGRSRAMPRGELMLMQLLSKAAQGDMRALKMAFGLMETTGLLNQVAAPMINLDGVRERLAAKLEALAARREKAASVANEAAAPAEEC